MNTRPYSRTQRLSSTLKKILSDIIEFEINDERLKCITITDVELSKDLRYAKVFFSAQLSPLPKEEITILINKTSNFIGKKVFEQMKIRITPTLKFIYDESIENGFKIEKILKEIKNE